MSPVSHSLVKALRSVPDFASLDDRTLLRIVGASMNLHFEAGSSIFEKGSPSEGLYIVIEGEVTVADPDDTKEPPAVLGPGQSFGELSLLLETTHSRRAEATAVTELMVIPEESFRELLELNADLEGYFRRRLEDRAPVRGEAGEAS